MTNTAPGSPTPSERERREAQTIAEHLPSGFTADFVPPPADDDGHETDQPTMPTPPLRPDSTPGQPSDGREHEHEHEVSSLTLQGGDVHRSLFRMAETPPPKHHRRAATFHETMAGSDAGSILNDVDMAGHGSTYGSIGAGIDRIASPMPVRDMMAPQGFRRAFLQRRQEEREQQAKQRRRVLLHERRISSFGAARLPITRNFVEFLELYGHFADEDLDASDEENEEEEEEQEEEEEEPIEDVEQQPLLGGEGGRSEAGKAKSGMAQSFFTLLKAFVGTGIMFLPKAYNNGGMAFSTVTLLVVAALSMSGFQLLLQCRQRFGGSYGDIGQAIAGPHMRSIVLGSIALSQLGFVCAGIVFVAENLASFAAAVAANRELGLDSGTPVSTSLLIVLEAAALVPLAFVRDIARLGPAALLGDVFIGLGLAYMYAYDLQALAARGWHVHETVEPWFNVGGYALTVGAAIFTFEGIGLILPIQSSMARPERFGRLLAVVMALITAAYVSVGALGYATFGTHTRTEVIDNYPRASPLVQAVQFLYALAVLAGLPVQLFPAVRILEGRLFGHRHSGKRSPRVKWIKNGLRAVLVALCAAIAILGAGQLDEFVALIGSLACVPLLFIYPPYLHYLGIASTPAARAADVALMVVGAVAMVYTTAVTVSGL